MKENHPNQTPDNRPDIKIIQKKYTLIKNAMVELLISHGSLDLTTLIQTIQMNYGESFGDSLPKYIQIIKSDLESQHIIERIPGTSPQLLRLIRKPQV